MTIDSPMELLSGLSPEKFMKQHWQKKPLLIRQAIADFKPLVDRSELFALAGQEDVQSRLVIKTESIQPGWKLKHGPFSRRSLPSLKTSGWTLLVQSVDSYNDKVHELLNKFRFIPAARLDDVMISFASHGGGVGPHFDSYDVFLFQASGQRRWRIGRSEDLSHAPDLPLKILNKFVPEHEYVLDPGDMLYLPPLWAHDGEAIGECMTYSIGFRAPQRLELVSELIQRMADSAIDIADFDWYRDPNQRAVASSAELPTELVNFAAHSLEKAVANTELLSRALGEYLTEPNATTIFESSVLVSNYRLDKLKDIKGIQLNRKTKMLFDRRHIFINGESFVVSGADAKLLQQLANKRNLDHRNFLKLSINAKDIVNEWRSFGWISY